METGKDKRINEQVLERYVLGELPSDRVLEIDKRLQKDEGLREKVRSLNNSNRDILNQYTPGTIVPEILNRYESVNRKYEKKFKTSPLFFRRLAYASPVFAAALLLILFVFPTHRSNPVPDRGINMKETTRVKGIQDVDLSKPHLVIHRKADDRIELLQDGAKAKAGDLLQLAYAVPEESYGVIFSIDGSGVVTLHFPEEKSGATTLQQQKKTFLPHAYELDNAPDFERFFLITSKSEIKAAKILEKARFLAHNPGRARVANLELDKTLNQFSILIEKENKQ